MQLFYPRVLLLWRLLSVFKILDAQLSDYWKSADNLSQRAADLCEDQPSHLDGSEVVYPLLVNKFGQGPLRSFNQSAQTHLANITIHFYYNGSQHRLRMQHNSRLSSALLMKGKPSHILKQGIEDCYYQGYCARDSHWKTEDFISLSTCDGLRGVILIGGVAHLIYPYGEHRDKLLCWPHILYKLSPSRERVCGNQSGQWAVFEELHKTEFFRRIQDSFRSNHRVKRNLEPKYVELAVVLDRTLLMQFNNSEDQTTDFLLQVTNMVDMYYQRMNLRVGLVYRQFWFEKDAVDISSNPLQTLQNFLQYSETSLSAVNYDIIQLISGRAFSNRSSGMAIPDSICTRRAVAVISHNGDILHLASVIAHMIGHNLGLEHDTADCQCGDKDFGCIMGRNIGAQSPKQFSSCSTARLEVLTKVGLGMCLINEPKDNPYPQFCGNGFVERGEQCDCGPAGTCDKIDPCCNATTCLLKSWATCRSGPCCQNCLPKAAAEMCRPSAADCDAAEFCDGINGECPANILIQDGQPCAGGEGFCYQGQCPLKDTQCAEIWGADSGSSSVECFADNNPIGNSYGHCGWRVDGIPKACAGRDVLCGLLQCQGGRPVPMLTDVTYLKTTVGSSNRQEYECKTVSRTADSDIDETGMVPDGTKCGDRSICVSHKCLDLSTIGLPGCPMDNSNRTCSGNGRCTTARTCNCNEGFRGWLCDEVLPLTSVVILSTERPAKTSNSPWTSALETKWLIVILCSVTALIVLVIIAAIFLYRFRTVIVRRKPPKTKPAQNGSVSDLSNDRTISFGQTPSYRADKNVRRKRRHKRRQSSSSDTDSDECAQPPQATSREVVIPEELYRQPQRSILKKSAIDADDSCSSQCSCSQGCSCSDSNTENAFESGSGVGKRENPGEIPPPVEFDTNYYTAPDGAEGNWNLSAGVLPDQKESQAEVAQYYKQFPTSDRYQVYPGYQQQVDSATDSAIDMPNGDESVSTISEIHPVYHLQAPYLTMSSSPSQYYAEPFKGSRENDSSSESHYKNLDSFRNMTTSREESYPPRYKHDASSDDINRSDDEHYAQIELRTFNKHNSSNATPSVYYKPHSNYSAHSKQITPIIEAADVFTV